jgi:hypothetical protein
MTVRTNMSWRRWTTSPVSGSTKVVTIDQTPGLGSGGEGDEVVVPFLEDRGGREKKAPRGWGGKKEDGEGEKERGTVAGAVDGQEGRSRVCWGPY